MTRTTDIVYVTVMSNGHCRIAKDEGREAWCGLLWTQNNIRLLGSHHGLEGFYVPTTD